MNTEYLFLKRSALQFRQDLIEIDESLDLLSSEEILAIAGYLDSIKFKMKFLEEKTASLHQMIKDGIDVRRARKIHKQISNNHIKLIPWEKIKKKYRIKS